MFLAVMSLAGTGVFAEGKPVGEKRTFISPNEKSICTVTVRTPKKSSTATVTCDCTQQQACNTATAAALAGIQ